ncbi:polymorphic toxin type 30 domain-containing protein [Propionibacteriaceae bacterium Y1700]|uniref:polymorphic toxin type 30 domain-containing protein n=1 Tax=Microlunatus sp. Y1700 TaxID=3418487 RepID=UPI003DA72388
MDSDRARHLRTPAGVRPEHGRREADGRLMPPGRRALDGVFGAMLDPLLKVVKRSRTKKPPLTKRQQAELAAKRAKRTDNPLDRVPRRAKRKDLTTMEHIDHGVMYEWSDNLGRHQVRIHGPDSSAPPGSNAASGHVYRISHNDHFYEDVNGNLYSAKSATKPSSPHYDPNFGDTTHIPWPSHLPLPYES